MKTGKALFYPSIEFNKIDWLKQAVLFYESIVRIVPPSAYYYDNDDVKAIQEEIGFIENLDPQKYKDQASEKFSEYLKRNILILPEDQLQEVIAVNDENQYRIHHDKLGSKLLDELDGLFDLQNNQLGYHRFSPLIGFSYMTYLADEIANQRKLPIITDYTKNSTSINIANLSTEETNEDLTYNLASLAIKSYMPKNFESVSIKQLVNFRKEHDTERRRFYSAIFDLSENFKKIDSSVSVEDVLNFHKKEIDDSVNDLRLSLKGLHIEVTEGLLGMSIPVILENLPPSEYSQIIKYAGYSTALLILGGKSYISKRKLRRESPYSFLLSLERSNLGEEGLLKELLKGKIII